MKPKVTITNASQWNHIIQTVPTTFEVGFQVQQKGWGQTEEGLERQHFITQVSNSLIGLREEELDRWKLYEESYFYEDGSGYNPWYCLVEDDDNIIVTSIKDNGVTGPTYDILLVGTPYLLGYSVKYNFLWRVAKFHRNRIVPIEPITENCDLAWDDTLKMWI